MADLEKKSDKEKEKAEVTMKRPGPGDDADAPAESSDTIIDKIIKVLELLEERIRELEERVKVAKLYLTAWRQKRRQRVQASAGGSMKEEIQCSDPFLANKWCKAGKAMLMFCIIRVA
jgi:ribosome-associated translation inhibitor RaiA